MEMESRDHSLGHSFIFDGYHGEHWIVDLVSPSGDTYTALKYRDNTYTAEVRFLYFFEDGIDPSTGERNFVQDDGTGPGPAEPTIKDCSGLPLGPYEVVIRTVYFGDEDQSGALSVGDTICQVFSYTNFWQSEFELTDEPYIRKLNDTSIQRGRRLRIVGFNFGDTPDGGEVRIGTMKHYDNPSLGKGRLLDRIKVWTDTKVVVRLTVPEKWEGRRRYIWLEKGGKKSNFKKLRILAPQP